MKPIVGRYLERLHDGLAAAQVTAPLQIMQSRGGLSGTSVARRRPVRLFLSGPAAGVIGGAIVGRSSGHRDLITIDVGGTSSDIALVEGGEPVIRAQGSIAGFPVRVPMVDVNAIGAGGGSVAWIDGAGGLRVGPQSAGSEPGPACYGRGGQAGHRHRCIGRPGLARSVLFRRRLAALDPALAHAAIEQHCGFSARAFGRGRGAWASIAWSTRRWSRASAWSRSAAASTRGALPWLRWAAPGRSMPRRLRRTEYRRRADPAPSGRALGRRPACRCPSSTRSQLRFRAPLAEV